MSKRDLSNKQACQLHPNEDYLEKADFIDPKDGTKFRELSAVISAVTGEPLQLPGRSEKKDGIVVACEGKKKRLVLNKTNTRAIKSHYGEQVKDWLKNKIVLYWTTEEPIGGKKIRNPQTGEYGGVRVRPKL